MHPGARSRIASHQSVRSGLTAPARRRKTDAMTTVFFYHLQQQPLEKVLPTLLAKTLERGWRAVVQAGTAQRVEALDAHLWTYDEDSFLPHATQAEEDAADNPIVLTIAPDNLNRAEIRFIVDGVALPEDMAAYERVMVIFDGNDDEALATARAQWKEVRAGGHEAQYWQQDEDRRWHKKG
jgi:DNA polymerase III subunit chi